MAEQEVRRLLAIDFTIRWAGRKVGVQRKLPVLGKVEAWQQLTDRGHHSVLWSLWRDIQHVLRRLVLWGSWLSCVLGDSWELFPQVR